MTALSVYALGSLAVGCGLYLLVRRKGKATRDVCNNNLPTTDTRQMEVAITRIVNRAYSHGGWMGCAGLIIQGRYSSWMRLMKTFTPASYERLLLVDQASASSPAHMRILENNPVMAAFGTAMTLRQGDTRQVSPASLSHCPVVVEFDVYLDGDVCKEVDAALWRGTELSAAERARLARLLATTTVISHGSLMHIMLERLCGISMHKSILQRSGGMTLHTWLRAYFQTLAECAPDVRISQPANRQIADVASSASAIPHLSVFLDVKSSGASAAALDLLSEGLNAAGIHVWGVGSFVHRQLNDIMRRSAPQTIIVPEVTAAGSSSSAVIELPTTRSRRPSVAAEELDHLLGLEPHMRHIAAHKWAEADPAIVAEGELPQAVGSNNAELIVRTVDGRELTMTTIVAPPPIAFHIFSFVGEIQAACDKGALPHGAHILFNGGTMISARLGRTPDETTESYHIDPRLLRELDDYRERFDLHLGYYTQEALLDHKAADLLVRTANDHPALFEHGFAYSGLSGQAVGDIRPSATAASIGWVVPWWARFLVGRQWRFQTKPGA